VPDPNEPSAITLARIEGMLSATLPQHAALLDEHGRLLTSLGAIVTQQGQDIAAIQAVAAERAMDRRTTPPWVAIAALIVAAAALIVTYLG
jgi:ferric-dicitrate binding protein FerR (iron transport regulator)